MLDLDYETVFQPCEQALHKLRDKEFLKRYYNANKHVQIPIKEANQPAVAA